MKAGIADQKRQLAKCRWKEGGLLAAVPSAAGFRRADLDLGEAPKEALALAARLAKAVSGVALVTEQDFPLLPFVCRLPQGTQFEAVFRAALGIPGDAPMRFEEISEQSVFLHENFLGEEPLEDYFSEPQIKKLKTVSALLKEYLQGLQYIRFHESLTVYPVFWVGHWAPDVLVGLFSFRVDTGGEEAPRAALPELLTTGMEALNSGDALVALEAALEFLPMQEAHDLRAQALFALRREEELADVSLEGAGSRLQQHGRSCLIRRLKAEFSDWLERGPFSSWLGQRLDLEEVCAGLERAEVKWCAPGALVIVPIRRQDGEWELVLELQLSQATISWLRLLPPLAATALRSAAQAGNLQGLARELNIAAFRCFQAGLPDYAIVLVQRALELDPENPPVQANHQALSAKQIEPPILPDRLLASLPTVG